MRPLPVFNRLNTIKQWNVLASWCRYRSAALVRLLGEDERTVRRYFLKKFGRTTQKQLDFLRQMRIEHLARRGVQEKAMLEELGYQQASHLSRQFKKHHKVAFRVWIRNLR